MSTNPRFRKGTLSQSQIIQQSHIYQNPSHTFELYTTYFILSCAFVSIALLLILKSICFNLPFENQKDEKKRMEDCDMDTIRMKRELEKEKNIRHQLNTLEKRLHSTRMRRATIESKIETARLESLKQEEWNQKGYLVYGNAWDESIDGYLPMKDIFSIPDNELDEIKLQVFHDKLMQGNMDYERGRDIRETARTAPIEKLRVRPKRRKKGRKYKRLSAVQELT